MPKQPYVCRERFKGKGYEVENDGYSRGYWDHYLGLGDHSKDEKTEVDFQSYEMGRTDCQCELATEAGEDLAANPDAYCAY